MPNQSDGITQSNSGRMTGGMQAAIGNNNQQSINTQVTFSEKVLSQEDVVNLLVEIQGLLNTSDLPHDVKKQAITRLESTMDEVKQKEPDKQLAAGNLKRMAEVLQNASKTLDAGKNVWEKVKPALGPLSVWLNVASHFFG
jgi:hypothetical protein